MDIETSKGPSITLLILILKVSFFYESDNNSGEIPCMVAEAPDLPSCFTQDGNYEAAREQIKKVEKYTCL